MYQHYMIVADIHNKYVSYLEDTLNKKHKYTNTNVNVYVMQRICKQMT